MQINLESPHTVYVIVAKDTNGFRRGFEKVYGAKLHYSYGEAVEALRALGTMAPQFTIGEAVIGYLGTLIPHQKD